MNISSIVIRVLEKNYDKLQEELEKNKICDFHFGDQKKGKMIVTIEGENVDEEIKKISSLQKMQYVISADMMQTYQEDLNDAIDEIEKAKNTPEILKNNDTKVEDIVYSGDLRKKDFHGGV